MNFFQEQCKKHISSENCENKHKISSKKGKFLPKIGKNDQFHKKKWLKLTNFVKR